MSPLCRLSNSSGNFVEVTKVAWHVLDRAIAPLFVGVSCSLYSLERSLLKVMWYPSEHGGYRAKSQCQEASVYYR